MNFNNKFYGSIKLFGIDIWITETLVNTWIIIGILILFAAVVRVMLNKFETIPRGFQNFIELIVDSMDGLIKENMGKNHSRFGGWFFGVFAFVLCSNLSGLFLLRPPTADLSTTLSLALTTFVLIHVMGIVTGGVKYFKGYLEPIPLLLPINIIGELAIPISLSFRLFGNIFGGLVIMGMIYNLFPLFLKLGLPGFLHIYFDVFAGALQTFIFVMLSVTFISDKLFET